VCDSLLSAARLGDIGTFFPPGDSKWKNADSSHLLSVCVKMVHSSGWNIMRIDVTVIGESPVIAPVREMLISRLAEIAAVPPERIWIKGTTTNTIGELAQGKGVACSVLSELERVSE
jgi:2-C-methyl-D-erythritol 2,4-cyclodiphosphate synthase